MCCKVRVHLPLKQGVWSVLVLKSDTKQNLNTHEVITDPNEFMKDIIITLKYEHA